MYVFVIDYFQALSDIPLNCRSSIFCCNIAAAESSVLRCVEDSRVQGRSVNFTNDSCTYTFRVIRVNYERFFTRYFILLQTAISISFENHRHRFVCSGLDEWARSFLCDDVCAYFFTEKIED